jgi:hypothetical protein
MLERFLRHTHIAVTHPPVTLQLPVKQIDSTSNRKRMERWNDGIYGMTGKASRPLFHPPFQHSAIPVFIDSSSIVL